MLCMVVCVDVLLCICMSYYILTSELTLLHIFIAFVIAIVYQNRKHGRACWKKCKVSFTFTVHISLTIYIHMDVKWVVITILPTLYFELKSHAWQFAALIPKYYEKRHTMCAPVWGNIRTKPILHGCVCVCASLCSGSTQPLTPRYESWFGIYTAHRHQIHELYVKFSIVVIDIRHFAAHMDWINLCFFFFESANEYRRTGIHAIYLLLVCILTFSWLSMKIMVWK